MNPLFPFGACIPDGEPHEFDGRVYVYGSHDKLNGKDYCTENYQVFSAPVDDLTTWSSKGTSYDKMEDPDIKSGEYDYMYAPDCVKGNDGKYYLYYCISKKGVSHGYSMPVKVAVSDYPDGPFKYHGFVKDKDGKPYLKYLTFDPGVINDDGVIRLYYGAWFPFFEYFGLKFILSIYSSLYFQRKFGEVLKRKADFMGSVEVELEDDMLTIKGEAKHITPIYPKGTSFEKHHFFEASSIRKYDGTYYFVYSSTKGHELCYATSKYPDKDFVFQGVLSSNADIGLEGITSKNKRNYSGNNHGSLLRIGDDFYIFYHKMTHRNWYSRVDCAEKITRNADGTFNQAEMTSMGTNPSPLKDQGVYQSWICSTLTNGKMPHINPILRSKMPAIVDDGTKPYIEKIKKGTIIGYKYFNFEADRIITMNLKGSGKGEFLIKDGFDGKIVGKVEITPSKEWKKFDSSVLNLRGKQALFFEYKGKGKVDFSDFEIK